MAQLVPVLAVLLQSGSGSGQPPHTGLLSLLLSGVAVLLLVGAWQIWRNRDR